MPPISPAEGEDAGDVDGGVSPEAMGALWRDMGSWPLTLAVRAFNQFDFRSYPGGSVNHSVANLAELVDRLIELGAGRPDAPFPLVVRLQVLRVGDMQSDEVFMSEVCVVETLAELREAFFRAVRRAADRFA